MTVKITSGDRQRADLISQTLQHYFDKNPGGRILRSTDAYEILVKKKVFEKDRHSGIKFRAFLKHLKNNNALNLIPQCQFDQGDTFTNWFFSTAKSQTVKGRNLIPLSQAISEKRIDKEKLTERVNNYKKLPTDSFTQLQLETRVNYPRAYERWSDDETNDLKEAFEVIKDEHRLSKIFKRQPSAIKARLIRIGLIQ